MPSACHQASVERLILSRIPITFGMMVTVESKSKDLHLYSWLSIFHSVSASRPEARVCVCQSICSTHGTDLIYASDTHAAANELFLNVCKKETIPFFVCSVLTFLCTGDPTLAAFLHSRSHSRTLLNGNFVLMCVNQKCLALKSGEKADTSKGARHFNIHKYVKALTIKDTVY